MAGGRWQKVYGILLSISIVVAGLCLGGACLGIWAVGGDFSREAVAQAFQPIAFPVYLCLGLTALGILWDIFRPEKPAKLDSFRQDWLILRRLQKRADLSQCPDVLREAVLAQRRQRRIRQSILAVLVTLSCCGFGWYLLTGQRFSRQDINGSVVGCVLVLLPCFTVCLAWWLVMSRKNSESCRREVALLKQSGTSGASDKATAAPHPALQYGLLALAAVLMGWGLYLGGAVDVLTKAINICTECIGLG